jgi:hypothetical protein
MILLEAATLFPTIQMEVPAAFLALNVAVIFDGHATTVAGLLLDVVFLLFFIFIVNLEFTPFLDDRFLIALRLTIGLLKDLRQVG